ADDAADRRKRRQGRQIADEHGLRVGGLGRDPVPFRGRRKKDVLGALDQRRTSGCRLLAHGRTSTRFPNEIGRSVAPRTGLSALFEALKAPQAAGKARPLLRIAVAADPATEQIMGKYQRRVQRKLAARAKACLAARTEAVRKNAKLAPVVDQALRMP